MKRKRKIQLIQLIIDRLMDSYYDESFGICRALTNTYYAENDEDYSENEYEYIREFLVDNKPNPDNQYKEFMNNEFWIDDDFWWQPIHTEPKTKQIRIDYLKKLIESI